MRTSVSDIINILSKIRLIGSNEESDIHKLIADALDENGIPFTHETVIGPHRRADFMCGSICIEVKKSKPIKSQLLKQIAGYLACESVTEVIVVSQKRIDLPNKLLGKNVSIVCLDRLWGIALP